VVFPYYTAGVSDRLNGFWHYLHEDYLQTLLEWGAIGSALWAVLFFGGIAVALRARFSESADKWRPRQRILLPLVVLGLASVAIHALVDFPLQIASIQLYVATYVGMCWSASRWHLTPPGS
jgi:O-antigen ligase